MNFNEVETIYPPNMGWLKYKLNSKEMDYVWRCIENKKENINKDLAGNISASYSLIDRGDWFWLNVISPLEMRYAAEFRNLGEKLPTQIRHPYCLGKWWVNYQKQNEFNPIHNHNGVYSFVIWMKIPYDARKQNQKDIARNSNTPSIGDFQFMYSNMLGENDKYPYHLNPDLEGTLLFFPAQLDHQVYPFYDCDEDRISVSGNVMCDTTKRQ